MNRGDWVRRYLTEQQNLRNLGIEQRLITNIMRVIARQPQTPFITQTYCRLTALNGQKIQQMVRSHRRMFIARLLIVGYRDNNNPNSPDNNLTWGDNTNNLNNNTNNSSNNNFNFNIIITLSLLLLGVLVITSFVILALYQVEYLYV
uniref:Uncharacterized protein n=1 Tax=Phialocephala europaea TaxID=242228 RepID=G8G1F2_9HELO|nr:hypothetical protein ORF_03 [Phialocephala europaea]